MPSLKATTGSRPAAAAHAPAAPTAADEAPAKALPTPAIPADEVGPPADLLRRFVARAADAATVFTFMWAMSILRVFWFIPKYAGDVDPSPWGAAFVPTATFVALYLGYEVLFLHWNKGQTPGRDWMHLRVVARDGGIPSVGVALRRAALPAAAMALPPMYLAAGVVVALGATVVWGPRRRSIPDVVAGTTLVNWDRDAHEPVDPRSLRKRPRALGMISALTRPGRAAEDFVVPDTRPADRRHP